MRSEKPNHRRDVRPGEQAGATLVMILLVAAASAPAATHAVSDWDGLQAAWQQQTAGDTTIVLERMVSPPAGSLDWLRPTEPHEHALVIRCLDGAGISWRAVYAGDERPLMDGLRFCGRSLAFIGGVFRDFNVGGAAIRANAPCQSVTLVNVWFANVGQIAYPPLRVPVETSRDAVITQCLGVYHDGCVVRVIGGGATDCVRGDHTWSHIYYLSTDWVYIAGVRIRRCGSPFAVRSRKSATVIVGCDVDDWALCACAKQDAVVRPSHLFALYGDSAQQEMYVVGNRFAGSPHSYITLAAKPDPSKMVFRNNDLSALTPARWARVTDDNGIWLPDLDLAGWQALGMDVPASQPAEVDE